MRVIDGRHHRRHQPLARLIQVGLQPADGAPGIALRPGVRKHRMAQKVLAPGETAGNTGIRMQTGEFLGRGVVNPGGRGNSFVQVGHQPIQGECHFNFVCPFAPGLRQQPRAKQITGPAPGRQFRAVPGTETGAGSSVARHHCRPGCRMSPGTMGGQALFGRRAQDLDPRHCGMGHGLHIRRNGLHALARLPQSRLHPHRPEVRKAQACRQKNQAADQQVAETAGRTSLDHILA